MLNINKSNIYYNGDSMRYMFKRVNRVLLLFFQLLFHDNLLLVVIVHILNASKNRNRYNDIEVITMEDIK